MDPAPAPILEMRGIAKSFPGVQALHGVSLTVLPGEVHALVGENGSGKSTLMKILAGAYEADGGEVRLDGRLIARPTPSLMLELGVAVIYQELMLAPHLTVAENIFLGRLPRTRFGAVDWRAATSGSLAVMARLGFRVDPAARVGALSVAQRQMVEIARALSRNARLIVLDEPSAVLGGAELELLFGVIAALSRQGVAFIYISHRLQEVFQVGQRVTVLRDGAVVGTHATGTLTVDSLIGMMVGRQLADIYPQRQRRPGAVALAVRGLSRPGVLHGIDLEVRQGEILGVCGLAGAGRTELLRALVGADRPSAGQLSLKGRDTVIRSPRAAIRRGLGLLPEDRKTEGCFLPQTVAFNVTIARLAELLRFGLVSERRERDVVGAMVRRLSIRTPGVRARMENLSGGNQQKCVLARNLNARCDVLLIDEPTRGVDVGAKREIYQLLARLADEERTAVVMVSSELPEILGLSDRIIVMRDGRVSGRFERGEASEEKIMQCAVVAQAA